jgi:signal peptidase I
MPAISLRRLVLSALLIVGAIGAALVVWPTQLGGHTGLAVVSGNSMAPLLQDGDLAVVRKRPWYEVGDIVLYRDDRRGTDKLFLHRIVGIEGDRFTLKGDANGFTDPAKPAKSAIIGELWFHTSGKGQYTKRIASHPELGALLFGTLFILSIVISRPESKRKRKRQRTSAMGNGSPPFLRPQPLWFRGVLQASLIGGLFFAVLLVVSLLAPVSERIVVPDSKVESVVFSYEGTAPRGVAYPSGRVRSGDAVFTNLVSSFRLHADYRVERGDGGDGRRGELALVLDDGAGWTWRSPLATGVVAGGRLSLTGLVDVKQLQARLRRLEETTGTVSASVTLGFELTLRGASSLEPRTFRIAFLVTENRMRLDESLGELRQSAKTGEPALVARRLHLGPISPRVTTLRFASLSGLVLALGALALLTARMRRLREDDQEAWTAILEGRPPIRSTEAPAIPSASAIVEIASLEDLVRLARQLGTPVVASPGGRYHVLDAGVCYTHGPPERDGDRARPACESDER